MKPQMTDSNKAQQFFADKMAFTTGPAELDRWMREKENINIIDVRRAEDYGQGHIPGAVSLPKDKWDTLEGLRRDKINVVYCYSQVCHLAAEGALTFASRGYSVIELEGGFKTWREHKLPIQALETVGR